MCKPAFVLGAILASSALVWAGEQMTLTPKGVVVFKQPPLVAPHSEAAAFVAYYWRARPGRADEYNRYILDVAERIDEDARTAGVFEEVRTVMPTPGPKGELPDWTHLRIFRLKNAAAIEGLSAGLDAATARVVPSDAQRKANTARSAELRDLVRREVWTELKWTGFRDRRRALGFARERGREESSKKKRNGWGAVPQLVDFQFTRR